MIVNKNEVLNKVKLKVDLLSILPSNICQVVAYRRLQTKANFKLLALKVVAVAYKRLQI